MRFKMKDCVIENGILKKYIGQEVILIPCGGEDSVSADREQWSDGSNTIAIAPGKVIAYERNDITNNILRKNGIDIDVDRVKLISKNNIITYRDVIEYLYIKKYVQYVE